MKWRSRSTKFLLLLALLVIAAAAGWNSCSREIIDSFSRPEWVHAESTSWQLKNSISAYFTEYRNYPVFAPDKDVTVESGRALMNILLAPDNSRDPDGRNNRGIVFFTDRSAIPMGEGRFRKGLRFDEDGGGELWDPWGNLYQVQLDTNFDNKIENPEAPGTQLPESILVWSSGPDGDFETWKDNVKSWMPRDSER